MYAKFTIVVTIIGNCSFTVPKKSAKQLRNSKKMWRENLATLVRLLIQSQIIVDIC